MAGKGRPVVEDKRDNQYRVLMNDEEDTMLAYCSRVTGMPKSQIFRKGIEVLYQQIQLNEANAEYDGHISLKRVIDCPHCGHSSMIDLADYETSSSSTERPMGPDVLHEFDCDDYECAGCGRSFRITGYISEYPLGAYEHEEINVEAIQREEELT